MQSICVQRGCKSMGQNLFDNLFGENNLRHIASAVNDAGKRLRDAFSISRFLSDASKAVVERSSDTARDLKHKEITPGHLFYGVLEHKPTRSVIAEFGVDPEVLRTFTLDSILGKLASGKTPDELDLSIDAKQVIESALTIAQELGYGYIKPEHLLLGLAEKPNGDISELLRKHGITAHELRLHVVQKFGTGPNANRASARRLEKYGRDLTLLARQDKLDPVIGRAREIESTIEILARRKKNNPVLIGEPGVGKTAIVEGLAQRIASGNVPEALRDRRIVELNISSLVSGSQYRGQFEERIKMVLDEVLKNADELILFIDELHTLVGAGGSTESSLDAANILKPALARGELHLIGATTLYEYQKHIEKDAALERRFQPVWVPEPTNEQTRDILVGLRDRFESHHKVSITDDALIAAVDLSDRYMTARFLPDKAIDVIDQAAAAVRISATSRPPNIQEMQNDVDRMRRELKNARDKRMDDRSARLAQRLESDESKLNQSLSQWRSQVSSHPAEVRPEHVAEVVSKLTGVPSLDLTAGDRERLLNMEALLGKRIVGQDDALRAVSNMVRISRAGFKRGRRPTAILYFLGPSGVGKTELSKALAEVLFGDEDALVRVDMSEFSEAHSVSRLIGAPPGYIGHDEGGQLTERVRRRPYSVVLLDEIDRAHPDAHSLLLQLFDEGRLTDNKGRIVDFSSTIIIATSTDNNISTSNEDSIERLRDTFAPEFLNRIDEFVVFRQLDIEDVEKIARAQLEQLTDLASGRKISLSFDESLVRWLSATAYNPRVGVRELRRQIRTRVEAFLAVQLLEGAITAGDTIVLGWNDAAKRLEFVKTTKNCA